MTNGTASRSRLRNQQSPTVGDHSLKSAQYVPVLTCFYLLQLPSRLHGRRHAEHNGRPLPTAVIPWVVLPQIANAPFVLVQKCEKKTAKMGYLQSRIPRATRGNHGRRSCVRQGRDLSYTAMPLWAVVATSGITGKLARHRSPAVSLLEQRPLTTSWDGLVHALNDRSMAWNWPR